MSFYLAIERYLLTPLFDAKTMSIITDMSLENLRTGNGILNLEAHCDSFLRDMRYLQRHDWIRTNDLFRVKNTKNSNSFIFKRTDGSESAYKHLF